MCNYKYYINYKYSYTRLLFCLFFIYSLFFLILNLNLNFNQPVFAAPQSREASFNPNQNIQFLSFSPHITDIIGELNLNHNLQGVSEDTPEHKKNNLIYQQKPLIADAAKIYRENIWRVLQKSKAANQTLIALLWRGGNPSFFETQLLQMGIPVVYLETRNLEDIIYSAYLINALAYQSVIQSNPIYNINLNNYRLNIQKLRALQLYLIKLRADNINNLKNKIKKDVLFFYPIWHQPWMILNQKNYSNDYLKYCGLKNAFLEAKTMTISKEAIIRQPFSLFIYHKNKNLNNLNNIDNVDNINITKPEDNILNKVKKLIEFKKYNKNIIFKGIDTEPLIRPNLKNIQNIESICKELNL